jgi:hypothetical protein
MRLSFKAKILKTGINWYVNVPTKITEQMSVVKGHIRIKGMINGFEFTKTLMPVKNSAHRLFVNGVMMKGGKTALGEFANFEIEQDENKAANDYPIPAQLVEQLDKNELRKDFDTLTASRKKDILKYLSYVKTQETLLKNIDKLIDQLKNNEKNVRIP